MKTLIVLTLFFIPFTTSDWLVDFDTAKQEAKQGNKQILLNFSGSDWCAPCIRLKKDVFDTPEFGEYAASHLVLVRADFPRQKKNKLSDKQIAHNETLAEKYNPDGKFPLTLLLDADGNIIRTWDGYNGNSSTEFIQQLDKNIHDK